MVISDRFKTCYKYLCITTLALIALGGSVRAMNAGLACPDWPLCFGDVIPDYHPQVYFEFIHRVLAGLVGFAILFLNVHLIRNRTVTTSTRVMCWASFLVLAIQVVLGGLTVLWQLHAKVVAAHLGLGMTLFGCLVWIYFSISETGHRKVVQVPPWLFALSGVVLVTVATQIMLGAFVASHYAALVCLDFPLCNGELIPTFKGIVGLQVIHRLGAYVTFLVVMCGYWYVRRQKVDIEHTRTFYWLVVFVFIQVGVGIANVLLLRPPLITVIHLTIGAVLWALCLRLVFLSRRVVTQPLPAKALSV